MSFKNLAKIIRVDNNYASLVELILMQYHSIIVQNYVPEGILSDPEQKKKDDIAQMMFQAKEKLERQYPDYFSLVRKAWETNLSNSEIDELADALDNEHVKKFFDISKKAEAELKVSMQLFTQQLFQSIVNSKN
jgi:hypothetical protein